MNENLEMNKSFTGLQARIVTLPADRDQFERVRPKKNRETGSRRPTHRLPGEKQSKVIHAAVLCFCPIFLPVFCSLFLAFAGKKIGQLHQPRHG